MSPPQAQDQPRRLIDNITTSGGSYLPTVHSEAHDSARSYSRLMNWFHRRESDSLVEYEEHHDDISSFEGNLDEESTHLDHDARTFNGGLQHVAKLQARESADLVYRKFTTLHTLSLLRRQNEILRLQEELDHLEHKIELHQGRSLSRTELEANDDWTGIVDKIEVKLLEYDKLLLTIDRVLSLRDAKGHRRNDTTRRLELAYSVTSDSLSPCAEQNDLVALGPSPRDTTFSKMMVKYFPASPQSTMWSSSTTRRAVGTHRALVAVINVLLLAILVLVLLVLPLLALVYLSRSESVAKPESALGILVIFGMLFMATTATLVDIERHELLVTTAAYAVVIVIFTQSFIGMPLG